jgi:hypothetical protein
VKSRFGAVSSRLQRRRWDQRAASWEAEGSAGLEAVVDAVLARSGARAGQVALDLGCGTGS